VFILAVQRLEFDDEFVVAGLQTVVQPVDGLDDRRQALRTPGVELNRVDQRPVVQTETFHRHALDASQLEEQEDVTVWKQHRVTTRLHELTS